MCTRPFVFDDRLFDAVSAVKLLQYVIANLNLKGLSFFIHTVDSNYFYIDFE